MDQVVLHAKKHILELVMTIMPTAPKGSIATNNLDTKSLSNHIECNGHDLIRLNRQFSHRARDIPDALLTSTIWIGPQDIGLGIQVGIEDVAFVQELVLPG